MELSSNPSLPQSGSSAGSGGDLGEANSHSFFYVPGTKRLSDRHNDVSGDYADIEEVQYMSRRPVSRKRSGYYDYGKVKTMPKAYGYYLGKKEMSQWYIRFSLLSLVAILVLIWYKWQYVLRGATIEFDVNGMSTTVN